MPKSFAPAQWLNRLNMVWRFVALLRFRASPFILVPVVANAAFAQGSEDEGIHFWPMEIEQRLLLDPDAPREITVPGLDWINQRWWGALEVKFSPAKASCGSAFLPTSLLSRSFRSRGLNSKRMSPRCMT